ncbi:MAG: hypothetical protein EOM61_05360 [Bacteroidia bacterium]|jgi:hypothetical protein|nr:hypothetical protein [Bacteroidia bacterium]
MIFYKKYFHIDKEFEVVIMWLENAGLIYKINRVSNSSLPLDGFDYVASIWNILNQKNLHQLGDYK